MPNGVRAQPMHCERLSSLSRRDSRAAKRHRPVGVPTCSAGCLRRGGAASRGGGQQLKPKALSPPLSLSLSSRAEAEGGGGVAAARRYLARAGAVPQGVAPPAAAAPVGLVPVGQPAAAHVLPLPRRAARGRPLEEQRGRSGRRHLGLVAAHAPVVHRRSRGRTGGGRRGGRRRGRVRRVSRARQAVCAPLPPRAGAQGALYTLLLLLLPLPVAATYKTDWATSVMVRPRSDEPWGWPERRERGIFRRWQGLRRSRGYTGA
jgi:hypothetical protein